MSLDGIATWYLLSTGKEVEVRERIREGGGRQRGYTISVLTCVTGLSCFWYSTVRD